jgi:transcriptional regulator with XRE-family HTH domain
MDRTGEAEIKQAFGARMRQLRKAKGLSQEALAFNCGLDRSYLGAIERGEKNVSLINIHRIASALGVEVGNLFSSQRT